VAFAQARQEAIKPVRSRIDASDAAAVKVGRREVHLTLKQATYDYERVQYNTVVSAAMKMLNTLEAMPPIPPAPTRFCARASRSCCVCLYPVAPHIGCALWGDLGFEDELGPLLDAPWPRWIRPRSRRTRSSSCCRSTASCAASSRCPPKPTSQRSKRPRARAPKVAKHSAGAAVKRVIVVPGKLVNVVV
jgi:leucyl-tRNA synthetase